MYGPKALQMTHSEHDIRSGVNPGVTYKLDEIVENKVEERQSEPKCNDPLGYGNIANM